MQEVKSHITTLEQDQPRPRGQQLFRSFASQASEDGSTRTWVPTRGHPWDFEGPTISADLALSSRTSRQDTQLSASPRPQSPSNISSSNDLAGADGFFGNSSTFAFVSKVKSDSKDSDGVHLHNTATGLQDYRGPEYFDTHSNASSENNTRQCLLPERELADSLVDSYFERVHPLYPFVHEGSFRAEYENMWNQQSIISSRPSWYALLNIVFARGCEFSDAVLQENIMATVSPFVNQSRQIVLSHIYRKGNLEIVQALLLMCHYLQGTMELNECWNLVGLMIRTAVSIGLQLNPENLPLTTVESEVRKRVWWGCFIIDRTISMKFGRPRALQAADATDVPLPLPVDDQYIHNESSSPRQPSGRPSTIDFFVYTIKLSKVIDNILQELYTGARRNLAPADPEIATPTSSEQSKIVSAVILLDGQLQSWWNNVPAHLRPESSIGEGLIFQRQRAVMQIR
jgi:hypothetical protein